MDAIAMNRPVEIPLSLLRLDRQTARAYTQIARLGASFPVILPAAGPGGALPETRWEVGFRQEMEETLRASARVVVTLEWAGARLRCCLPPAGMRAWLSARMPDLDLDELPEPLYAAAVEALVDEVLDAAGALGNGPARLVDLALDGDAAAGLEHEWTLRLRNAESGMTGFVILSCDGLGLMLLAGALGQRLSAPQTLDPAAVPVRMRAEVGACTLSLAELRGLAEGDVVFLDEHRVDGQGQLWMRLDTRWGLGLRAQDGKLVVAQAWEKVMSDESVAVSDEDGVFPAGARRFGALAPRDAQEDAGADGDGEGQEARVDFGLVPVRLDFDLGERLITLDRLRTLAPGEVFELDRPVVDGCVRIRANGMDVGLGELVEVDGNIGVRLKALRLGDS
jgi:type III secretion protein Q